jgi:hypothetical protein
MPYIGAKELKASDIRRFNVTGSTNSGFTLTWTPPNEQSLIVTINGIKQQEDAYSVSGTTLTLSSNLVATDKLEVIGINDIGTTITPAQNSVDTDKIANNAVTTAKIADDQITSAKLANAINITSGNSLTIDSGATITNSGTASGFGLFTSYAIIADQKASGTNGGASVSGSWQTRDLNTEISDPDGIVSISSNQFTLGAGNYFIRWSAPGWRTSAHQTRLYDVTGAVEVQVGSTEDCQQASSSPQTRSFGQARVSIVSNNTYEIQHRFQTSTAFGLGYGVNNTWGITQYAAVEIFKEA